MRIDERSRKFNTALLAVVFCSALFLPLRAQAALGGDVTSVEADQKQMKAKRSIQTSATYSVHEITSPAGTVVREYVSSTGKVFGVAWRGPFLPNFSQLLGTYYPQFAKAAQNIHTAQPRRSHNAPLSISGADFVMHSVGHLRAYAGHAYLPVMVPAGIKAEEIR